MTASQESGKFLSFPLLINSSAQVCLSRPRLLSQSLCSLPTLSLPSKRCRKWEQVRWSAAMNNALPFLRPAEEQKGPASQSGAPFPTSPPSLATAPPICCADWLLRLSVFLWALEADRLYGSTDLPSPTVVWVRRNLVSQCHPQQPVEPASK